MPQNPAFICSIYISLIFFLFQGTGHDFLKIGDPGPGWVARLVKALFPIRKAAVSVPDQDTYKKQQTNA